MYSSPRLSSQALVTLLYHIDDCSKHSGRYGPQNIIENRPTEQASRWSSAETGGKQYITLRLDSLSVVSEYLSSNISLQG